MTKKDYDLIACIFKKNAEATDEKTTKKLYTAQVVSNSIAQQFAAVLARENARFDSTKFLNASGVTEFTFKKD